MTGTRARRHGRLPGCSPASTRSIPGTSQRTCRCPRRLRGITLIGPLLADASARPAPAGTPRTCSPSTGTRRRPPARKAPSAATGRPAPARPRGSHRVRFPAATCRACPARDKCTTAKWTGRQLHLRPREIHEAVAAARAGQDTKAWQRKYAARAWRASCTRPPASPASAAPAIGLPTTSPHRRRRHQRHPARRLVHRQAPGQDPDHPPSAAPVRPRRMRPN